LPAAKLVPALREHIQPVCEHVRQKDADEIYAGGGWTVRECLEWGFDNSLYVSTLLMDGEPVAILGVTPYMLLSEIGVPWMIASTRVKQIPVQFLRISRRFVRAILMQFPRLINYVDDRHSEAIKYLTAVGF
jgi:hypothetical protein